MTYKEKLLDPRWQKKRLEIFNRDNWECKQCGRTDNTLHVHHLSYENKKNPWDVSNKNLKTLCFICHHIITDLNENGMVVYEVENRLEKIYSAYCCLNGVFIVYSYILEGGKIICLGGIKESSIKSFLLNINKIKSTL